MWVMLNGNFSYLSTIHNQAPERMLWVAMPIMQTSMQLQVFPLHGNDKTLPDSGSWQTACLQSITERPE
jgi:hypothetical protein